MTVLLVFPKSGSPLTGQSKAISFLKYNSKARTLHQIYTNAPGKFKQELVTCQELLKSSFHTVIQNESLSDLEKYFFQIPMLNIHVHQQTLYYYPDTNLPT
ncbi:MAG: hypothetical protein MHMPM18_001444 [Marteilia pararefringens]